MGGIAIRGPPYSDNGLLWPKRLPGLFFCFSQNEYLLRGRHKIYIFHLRTYVSQDIFFHQFSFVFHQLKANESLSVSCCDDPICVVK
jgi:hypothetical protein